jgi:hypothetical protein
MKILQIIIKNTSTLDYTAPIINAFSQDPSNEVVVLYNVLNKKQILRNSRFYTNMFDLCGVTQYDLTDFLKYQFQRFDWILRKIFRRSRSDKIAFLEYVLMRKELNPHRSALWCYFQELKQMRMSIMVELSRNLISIFEKYVIRYFVKTSSLIEEIGPDIILYDNRSARDYPGSEDYFKYMDKKKIPVVLVPHGPHFRDPLREYCPFRSGSDELPDYCDYWMPLRFGTPWKFQPTKKHQFVTIGYPGFDGKWLGSLLIKNRIKQEKQVLNCLFIIRKYLSPNVERNIELDPYVLDHSEFISMLNNLAVALHDENCHLIIKPHPSNNFQLLESDLGKSEIASWEISHEPMYAIIDEIDFVVSLPSTISLLPLIAGVPTIILNTKLQQLVHEEWDILAGMYGKLSWFLEDVNRLGATTSLLLNELREGSVAQKSRKDIDHLRYYYNNSSVNTAIKRLEELFQNANHGD